MSKALCISVTFLDPRFHGRGDRGAPEWPPSPLRLFQAMVAGNGRALGTGSDIESALRWLESQPPPLVFAPHAQMGTLCPLYVPNNAMDEVAKSWVRGNAEAGIAEHRTLKTLRPTHLRDGDTVHYLWPIMSNDGDSAPIEPLTRALQHVVALGLGIDLVVAQCRVLPLEEVVGEGLERWEVAQGRPSNTLRCPIPGTLDALIGRHKAFLNRVSDGTFHPVPALTAYRMVGYRRDGDPIPRSYAVFELRHDDDTFCAYPLSKLIHIAGMVRHQAKEAMLQSPPVDVGKDWVERYVAGHRDEQVADHRQFSYLPLPSIGRSHTDPALRRVMITAPAGDDAWLTHLVHRLAGRQLKPERGEFGEKGAPTLLHVEPDKVAARYMATANRWASVTPVILPGHNDRKAGKTIRLIERTLEEAGVEQQCTFEWNTVSQFPKVLSAHKYDRQGRPLYIKPKYLQDFTALHLTLTFEGGVKVPGPIVLGAGRHCGFGLMAAI